jgi:uncharacterized protein YegL
MDKKDIQQTIQSAIDENGMNPDIANLIINNLDTSTLTGFSGVDSNDLESADITLLSLLIDVSPSMKNEINAVNEGFNILKESLEQSQNADSILVSTRTFNENQTVIHGFRKLEDMIPVKFVTSGYSTALYDTVTDALMAIRTYSEHLNENGTRTKCIMVVFSDGEDRCSSTNPNETRILSSDCLKQENFILVYIGYRNDLDSMADAIGFPIRMMLDKNDPDIHHKIRENMDQISKSIIRTSQNMIADPNSFL